MTDNHVSGRRIHAFRTCGTQYWILRHRTEPARFKITPGNCHDRLCRPCNAHRSATLKTNVLAHLRKERHRFLTLTLRHNGDPLDRRIDHLYHSFRRLRQRSFWRRRVIGGLAMLELEYNTETGRWHAHLHAILTGQYLPLRDLVHNWNAATRDSIHVKINDAGSRRKVVGYIVKYANKPIPPSVTHLPEPLREAVTAIHSRRFVIPFGTWRHWHLLKDPTDAQWEMYGSEADVLYRSVSDDALASIVAAMLCTADPFTGEFFVELDQLPPDT